MSLRSSSIDNSKEQVLLQRLQQPLQMGRLLSTQGDEGHDQHGSPASGDEAPQHEDLSNSALAAASGGAVYQVAAAQHPRLHQALCLFRQGHFGLLLLIPLSTLIIISSVYDNVILLRLSFLLLLPPRILKTVTISVGSTVHCYCCQYYALSVCRPEFKSWCLAQGKGLQSGRGRMCV